MTSHSENAVKLKLGGQQSVNEVIKFHKIFLLRSSTVILVKKIPNLIPSITLGVHDFTSTAIPMMI